VCFTGPASENSNCKRVNPHTTDEQRINGQYFAGGGIAGLVTAGLMSAFDARMFFPWPIRSAGTKTKRFPADHHTGQGERALKCISPDEKIAPDTRLGFIGLGYLGSRTARHLIAAPHPTQTAGQLKLKACRSIMDPVYQEISHCQPPPSAL
jgi:hypothetical protein